MEKSEPRQQDIPKEDESEDDAPISQQTVDQDPEKGRSAQLDIEKADEERATSDVEEQDDPTPPHANVIAGEDYSVFTVPQKRSIIVAGSFLAWFSPVSG